MNEFCAYKTPISICNNRQSKKYSLFMTKSLFFKVYYKKYKYKQVHILSRVLLITAVKSCIMRDLA